MLLLCTMRRESLIASSLTVGRLQLGLLRLDLALPHHTRQLQLQPSADEQRVDQPCLDVSQAKAICGDAIEACEKGWRPNADGLRHAATAHLIHDDALRVVQRESKANRPHPLNLDDASRANVRSRGERQGTHAVLAEESLMHGWPALHRPAGRFMICLVLILW